MSVSDPTERCSNLLTVTQLRLQPHHPLLSVLGDGKKKSFWGVKLFPCKVPDAVSVAEYFTDRYSSDNHLVDY